MRNELTVNMKTNYEKAEHSATLFAKHILCKKFRSDYNFAGHNAALETLRAVEDRGGLTVKELRELYQHAQPAAIPAHVREVIKH